MSVSNYHPEFLHKYFHCESSLVGSNLGYRKLKRVNLPSKGKSPVWVLFDFPSDKKITATQKKAVHTHVQLPGASLA